MEELKLEVAVGDTFTTKELEEMEITLVHNIGIFLIFKRRMERYIVERTNENKFRVIKKYRV